LGDIKYTSINDMKNLLFLEKQDKIKNKLCLKSK